jgi:hypothetical protein
MNRESGPSLGGQHRRVAMVIVWLIAAVYLALRAGDGWMPHDEGLLGQSAERVMAGELPHRDFDDPYTGGLACLHAFAFRLLGVDLVWPRLVLLAFSLVFVPTLYSIAVRAVSPVVAGLATLLCVAWSLPNYFAALPSWYNLFFAVFGTWALLRFADTRRWPWLLLAGVLGGLSVLFKVSGFFYLAGAGLFLLYHEQLAAADEPPAPRRGLFPLVSALAVAAYVAAVAVLIRHRFTLMDGLHFFVPSVGLAAVLWLHERRLGPRAAAERWRRLGASLAVFGLGAVAPLAIFALPYAVSSSLGDLFYGVFVLPQKRLDAAAYPLPPPATLLAVVPLAVLLLVRIRSDSIWKHPVVVTVVGLGCGVLALYGGREEVYSAFWNSARPTVPLVTLAGCWLLAARGTADEPLSRDRRQVLFLLLAMTATVSLVQYPYSFGIYFCYAAPVVILAWAHVAASRRFAPHHLQLCVLGLYLAFGILWLNRGYVRAIGVSFVRIQQDTVLDAQRARLRVPARQAKIYQDVVAEVRSHSAPESFIYATADCPEIYFLADRGNPTRTFYDFFDADFQTDPAGRAQRILAMLDEREIKVVVLRWSGEFSGELSPQLVASLQVRFPQAKHFWYYPQTAQQSLPDFTVAWRE